MAALEGKTIKQCALEKLCPPVLGEEQAWADLKIVIEQRIADSSAGAFLARPWRWWGGLSADQSALSLYVDTRTWRCVGYTRMKSSDLIRLLEADGWTQDRVRGSHHVFRHPTKPGIVVVPNPKKDLGTGLTAAIRKQAGL